MKCLAAKDGVKVERGRRRYGEGPASRRAFIVARSFVPSAREGGVSAGLNGQKHCLFNRCWQRHSTAS